MWQKTMVSIVLSYCLPIVLALQFSRVLSYSLKVEPDLLLTLSILICDGYGQLTKGAISAYITNTLVRLQTGNVFRAEPPHIHMRVGE